jgi:hypothetical protein
MSVYSDALAVDFTPAEDAIAIARGTTSDNVKNTLLSAIRDAQAAVKDAQAVTEAGATRDALQAIFDALGVTP